MGWNGMVGNGNWGVRVGGDGWLVLIKVGVRAELGWRVWVYGDGPDQWGVPVVWRERECEASVRIGRIHCEKKVALPLSLLMLSATNSTTVISYVIGF